MGALRGSGKRYVTVNKGEGEGQTTGETATGSHERGGLDKSEKLKGRPGSAAQGRAAMYRIKPPVSNALKQ